MTNKLTADLHRMAAAQRSDDAKRVEEFNQLLGTLQQANSHVDEWRNHLLSQLDKERDKMIADCTRRIEAGFQEMARSLVEMSQSVQHGLIPAMQKLGMLLDQFDEKPDRAH